MDFLNISIGFYYSLKKSQISNSNEFPLGKTSNLKEILLRPDTARISLFFTEVEFNYGSFLSSYFFILWNYLCHQLYWFWANSLYLYEDFFLSKLLCFATEIWCITLVPSVCCPKFTSNGIIVKLISFFSTL